MRRLSSRLAVLVLLVTPGCAYAQSAAPYLDPKQPPEWRVDDLMQRLTPDEKLSLLTGTGFTTQPIPRLGIPAMGMVDGPQGVRGGTQGTQGPATLFPSGVDLAATWDRDLMRRVGAAIGEEVLNKGEGAFVLLGPDVNIHRSPLGGRNGESFTEDPFLNAELALPYVQGVQNSGAAACVKHFACNNEEVDRNTVDVQVDERALREIYLPGFQAGVQGRAYTVMAAYNKINGSYATANKYLLTTVLKQQWAFDGLVMSDWGAVHDTAGAVNAGNDLEMPGGEFLTVPKLKAALAAGTIRQDSIDDSARRILRTIIRVGLLDPPAHHPDPNMVNSPEHRQLTYTAASEAMVLLKNDHALLPLDRTHLKSIAIIGPAAVNMQFGAMGSPAVQPFYSISPLDGIKKIVGDGIAVNYVEGVTLPKPFPDPVPAEALTPPDGGPGATAQHGLLGDYFTSADLSGTPAATRIDPQIQFFRGPAAALPAGMSHVGSIRWTGKLTAPGTGSYTLSLFTSAGCRVYLDDKSVIDDPKPGGRNHSGKVDLQAGRTYSIRVELLSIPEPLRARLGWTPPLQNDIQDAAAAAAKSDVAVVFVTTYGTDGEGRDRPSMALPGDQNRLIEAVAAANRNTIVVLNSGTPVEMTPWLGHIPTLLDAGFPGQEGGHAIASVLFGDVNPSGKLTDTFGKRREDYPDYGNFPGTNGVVRYAEGIYVGYRHFDKRRIAPTFPFGYGLSYTTFRYANLKLSQPTLAADGAVHATVDVTNTGRRVGAEIVQLYVHDLHPKVDRPVRELKGFERVEIQPGQTRTVSFTIEPQALAYYDAPGSQWKADAGSYQIEIGVSSRDIRLTGDVRLTGAYTRRVR